MNRVTLITGGGRSGKSSFALSLVQDYNKKAFIATAEPFDDEMRHRISRHQEERGEEFATIEEPIDPADALLRIPPGTTAVVMDCITVWLGNLMHHLGETTLRFSQVERFLSAIKSPPCDLVIVTNEVGLGLIPADPMSRKYRDISGRVNQEIARIAHEVYMVVCGIPVKIK